MRAHRVTLLVLDEDHVPSPERWDWDVFEIAPKILCVSSEEVSLEEAGFAAEAEEHDEMMATLARSRIRLVSPER